MRTYAIFASIVLYVLLHLFFLNALKYIQDIIDIKPILNI